MLRIPAATALVIALAGCSIGQRGETTALALAPRGAIIEIGTTSGPVRGELLEMRDDGALLLTPAGVVTLVGYDLVQRGRAEAPAFRFTGSSMRSGRLYERLRNRSRYPQGMTQDVEARLLQALGQEAVRVHQP